MSEPDALTNADVDARLEAERRQREQTSTPPNAGRSGNAGAPVTRHAPDAGGPLDVQPSPATPAELERTATIGRERQGGVFFTFHRLRSRGGLSCSPSRLRSIFATRRRRFGAGSSLRAVRRPGELRSPPWTSPAVQNKERPCLT